MTTEEFLEQYNGSPIDEEELAYLMHKIDDDDLRDVVNAYLDALDEFRATLEMIGYEYG